MNVIDKLGWLRMENNRLLVARSKGKDTYYIPGGKREPGETDQEALIREIKEELSVDLAPTTIKYCETFEAQADGKPDGTLVKITCYFADFTGDLQANAEIEEVAWFSYGDRARCSLITQIIMDWLKSEEKYS